MGHEWREDERPRRALAPINSITWTLFSLVERQTLFENLFTS
jgi:hypothetical protein